MVLQILGEIDDSHPSVAKLPLDPVSIAKRRRELLEQFHGPLRVGENVSRVREAGKEAGAARPGGQVGAGTNLLFIWGYGALHQCAMVAAERLSSNKTPPQRLDERSA